jgi:hypothetical protein
MSINISIKNEINSSIFVHFKTIRRTKILLNFIITIIILLSFVFYPYYIAITNCVIPLLMCFTPITKTLQDDYNNYTKSILIMVFKWGVETKGFQSEQCPPTFINAWETMRDFNVDFDANS